MSLSLVAHWRNQPLGCPYARAVEKRIAEAVVVAAGGDVRYAERAYREHTAHPSPKDAWVNILEEAVEAGTAGLMESERQRVAVTVEFLRYG